MAYTIVDLLDKFILIEQKGYEMFMVIAANEAVEERIKALARIFASEEKRHSEIYKGLKEKMAGEPGIDVDLGIYDRASKLIYEFLNGNRIARTQNAKDILEFCLDFEKENLALIMSIQGILVSGEKSADSKNYRLLEELIGEEQKHIKNIELFLK